MSRTSSSSSPSEASRRHTRRKTQARLQLVGVLLAMLAGFGLFFSYALTTQCRTRWPEMIGILFGGGIANVLLLGAVWARQSWARIVLIASLALLSVGFGLYLLALMTNPIDSHGPGVRALSLGTSCLLVSGAWLIFSKRIRYLTTPAGSGNRA